MNLVTAMLQWHKPQECPFNVRIKSNNQFQNLSQNTPIK